MHPALRMRADLEDRAALAARYEAVRRRTTTLCERLTPEDMTLQSMPDASPTKWHLGHTTWYFETFILGDDGAGLDPVDASYALLFNSYYQAAGPQWTRAQRGLLSRPTVDAVMAYREAVDSRMTAFIQTASEADWARLAPLIELGLNHEQQHQELALTDIKHAFSLHPSAPAVFAPVPQRLETAAPDMTWLRFDEGVRTIGCDGSGFAYDNEMPRHPVYVAAFDLADRPVTNGEVLAFIEDGGYATASLWLSDGWADVCATGRAHPEYWRQRDDAWWEFTLHGLEPLNPAAPACHLTHYEADAIAAWAGARLPTEAEWEVATPHARGEPRWYTPGWRAHPLPVVDSEEGGLHRMFGDVWEWTASAYTAYPGYAAPTGAVGEYNGKFMSGQMVLRGGSCATPEGHIRPTYRNFLTAGSFWQFSGVRLAKDA